MWRHLVIALAGIDLFLLAILLRPAPLASSAPPVAVAAAPASAAEAPSLLPLREKAVSDAADPLDDLIDTPVEATFGAMLAALGELPPDGPQAAQLLVMARQLDASRQLEASCAEGLRQHLEPAQLRWLDAHAPPPLPVASTGMACLEGLARRAGSDVPAWATPPSPLPVARVDAGAEALLPGLAALVDAEQLDAARLRVLLPYVETCVAARQQQRHQKRTLLDMMGDGQRAGVRRALTGGRAPAATLAQVVARLQPLARDAVLPGAPQDPYTMVGARFWRDKTDPQPDTEAVRAEGRRHYDRLCWQCHGKEYHGNGPMATHLFPKPASLTEGTRKYGDQDWALMRTIMEGIPGTAMPPSRGQLTEREGWQLVRFVNSVHR